jgi:hypothetical protein
MDEKEKSMRTMGASLAIYSKLATFSASSQLLIYGITMVGRQVSDS